MVVHFTFPNTELTSDQELASALQSAHPKIQKMCEEESDDAEAVAKLLQINDSIGRTIERYKLVKKGDVEGAAKIPKGTLGTTTGVSKNANNEFSLIDFDPEPAASSNGDSAQAAEQGTTSLEDDLLGLSFGDRPQAGPVSLGFGILTLLKCVLKVLILINNDRYSYGSSTWKFYTATKPFQG